MPEPSLEPSRRPGTFRRLARRIHLRTVPNRIRGLTVVAVLAVGMLFLVANWAIGNARDGLQTIGQDAGPQVVATGDLFFALSDMDAQVAHVLLLGRDANLGRHRRGDALAMYEQRRAEANQALLQAAQLAGEDESERRTVRAVLDGLGRYERLSGQALQLDQRLGHSAGPPSREVLNLYRSATDLMKLELLPQANNLTLNSATIVRKTHESKQSSVSDGRFWVLGSGVLVAALLLAAQLYLARRFRRVVNPALALATLGTLALTAAAVGLLGTQASKLDKAKIDGFDSVLALSRARAISDDAHADATRYLLDPERSDTYEQVYFDKSQSIFYLDADKTKSLSAYYANLDAPVNEYLSGQNLSPAILGFFGDQGRLAEEGPEREAVGRVLTTYRAFQQGDRRIRDLVRRDERPQAVRAHTERADFEQYDRALQNLATQHRATFTGAIEAGDKSLNGWNVVLPVGAAIIVILILVGVRPRLAEYR